MEYADHLCRLGVQAETRVGLCLERSGDLVIALLAILKAGGAYVPLDPANPTTRLTSMLRRSGARLVLAAGAAAARLSDGPWRVIDVSR